MAYSRGGRISGAVLNEAAVRNIRLLYAQDRLNTREQAAIYGVNPETIRRIARWDSWKHVSEEGPGATVKDWAEPPPEVIAASQARMLKLAGIELPKVSPGEETAPVSLISTPPFPAGDSSRAAGYGAKPMPTMAESMAAAARESDEVAARVKATFEAKDAAGNAELAGLLGTGGIQSPMSNEKLKDSHD